MCSSFDSSLRKVIPVVLFAYARPVHLARVLDCLKENSVPLIVAYADGAKSDADTAMVAEVGALLKAIDWCDVRLIERSGNFGLGLNVRVGVTEVAEQYGAFIVWEDDLICVPGTYAWMCSALRHYDDDERVMSVSAWTHPRVVPEGIKSAPYFDARADCWVWGAWARSWAGMNQENALEKMRLAATRGVAPVDYGADLPEQAAVEKRRNVWAVRWLYHHFQHGGLCLRPPWSMVEHIGFDQATNAAGATAWVNPPLRSAPPMPNLWPVPVEHAACQDLWRAACPQRTWTMRILRKIRGKLRAWGL